jgi:hypothetical protein
MFAVTQQSAETGQRIVSAKCQNRNVFCVKNNVLCQWSIPCCNSFSNTGELVLL